MAKCHFSMGPGTPVCGSNIEIGDCSINGTHPFAKDALKQVTSDGTLCIACKAVLDAYRKGHDDGIEAVTGCSRAERMALPVQQSRMLH